MLLVIHVGGSSFGMSRRELDTAEQQEPNPSRMEALLRDKGDWDTAGPYLPRYYTTTLRAGALDMLRRGGNAERGHAIRALTAQLDTTPEVKTLVRAVLLETEETEENRSNAAQYLRLLGDVDDLDTLWATWHLTSDRYTRALLRAAEEAITLRIFQFPISDSQNLEPLRAIGRSDPEQRLQLGKALLLDSPTEQNQSYILTLMQDWETHAPYWRYGRPGHFNATQLEGRETPRWQLMTLAAGYPLDGIDRIGRTRKATRPWRAEESIPYTLAVMGPTRGFFEEKGAAYGFFVKSAEHNPFSGSFHIAADVAWRQDGTPVVAVAPGVVRRVSIASHSWGGLVVLEHQHPVAGKFCTLYSHLGPVVPVRTGETVVAGQLLGVIGRSYTWENGGYRAHLHFGLHRGSYAAKYQRGQRIRQKVRDSFVEFEIFEVTQKATKGRNLETGETVVLSQEPGGWITGYLSRWAWEEGNHGWVDPHMVLGRMEQF